MVHAVQAMVHDLASLPKGVRAKQREVLQGQAAKLETLFRQGEAGGLAFPETLEEEDLPELMEQLF